MVARSKGLGKGLGALLQNTDPASDEVKGAIFDIKVTDISPNASQPRKRFEPEKLDELAASIKENGIIQPVIVCRSENGYQIVAGERRWRAARIAGLKTIPAIIRELTDVQILQQALIENIQRQDLNPLEEASALKRLIEEHHMTQEKVASVVGRSRPAVANMLRLLQLPDDIQGMIQDETVSAGHARALLSIEDEKMQKKAAWQIAKRGLSVREAERLAKRYNQPPKTKKMQTDAYVLSVREVEQRLAGRLGTRVKLNDRQGKGTIQISYYSNDDLDRLIEIIERD
jgi:ParB family transcriptional regulator, chromosome partitioning protein